VDPDKHTVTVKNVEGETKTYSVNPEIDLMGVRAGDDVVAQYSRGLEIVVTASPDAAQPASPSAPVLPTAATAPASPPAPPAPIAPIAPIAEKKSPTPAAEVRAIAEEATLYGLPMVMNYAIMYEYAVNTS